MVKVYHLDRAVSLAWDEALRQFLLFKQAQGLADTTLFDYERFVRQFFRLYPEAFHPARLKAAALAFLAQKVKPATFNLRLTYLGGFFAWCVREGVLPENPLAGIKRRRTEGRTVSLDEDLLKKLLALPDRGTYAGLRDYALLLLTLDTGIRPREAFSLLPQDVNLRGLEVVVRGDVAKTRTRRTLPISPATAEAIRQLLQARHPSWRETVRLFCTWDGKPLGKDSWRCRLEDYSRLLGTRIRPYDLRHAFALMYLRGGGHAFALQRTLGHTTMTMTRRYVNLTQSDLREQHSVASPLNVLVRGRRVRKVRT